MDIIETADIVTESFGKTLVKTLVLGTATSASIWTGILIVGLAYNKITDITDARRSKKTKTEK